MWGDLSAVHKLETRFAEFFPNGQLILYLANCTADLPRFPAQALCSTLHLQRDRRNRHPRPRLRPDVPSTTCTTTLGSSTSYLLAKHQTVPPRLTAPLAQAKY